MTERRQLLVTAGLLSRVHVSRWLESPLASPRVRSPAWSVGSTCDVRLRGHQDRRYVFAVLDVRSPARRSRGLGCRHVNGDEPRPWWASPPGTDPAIDDADPIAAARAARRRVAAGPGHAAGPKHQNRYRDDPGQPGQREAAAGAGSVHQPDICGICPICTAARALGETRPEVLEHLTEAAHHLAAALRSILDVPGGHHDTGEGEDGSGGH